MKMKDLLRLVLILLLATIPGCIDPDPFGCEGRGELSIADVQLSNAIIGIEYCELLTGTAKNLCWIELIDPTVFPAGLDVVDAAGGWSVAGTPDSVGTFRVRVLGTEFGTQCTGRSD